MAGQVGHGRVSSLQVHHAWPHTTCATQHDLHQQGNDQRRCASSSGAQCERRREPRGNRNANGNSGRHLHTHGDAVGGSSGLVGLVAACQPLAHCRCVGGEGSPAIVHALAHDEPVRLALKGRRQETGGDRGTSVRGWRGLTLSRPSPWRAVWTGEMVNTCSETWGTACVGGEAQPPPVLPLPGEETLHGCTEGGRGPTHSRKCVGPERRLGSQSPSQSGVARSRGRRSWRRARLSIPGKANRTSPLRRRPAHAGPGWRVVPPAHVWYNGTHTEWDSRAVARRSRPLLLRTRDITDTLHSFDTSHQRSGPRPRLDGLGWSVLPVGGS